MNLLHCPFSKNNNKFLSNNNVKPTVNVYLEHLKKSSFFPDDNLVSIQFTIASNIFCSKSAGEVVQSCTLSTARIYRRG